jgi:ABC-type spermidine/putrescine transport system permease subunit II
VTSTVNTAPLKRRTRMFTAEDRVWVSAGLFTALSLTIGLPTVLIVLWGFADRWTPPNLLPEGYTLAHWQRILVDTGILGSLWTSLTIAITVTLATALIAMPTAWAMAKFPFRFKRFVEIFILAPIIIPGIVVAVGIGQVFLYFGLAYSIAGVVLVQMVGTLPFMIRLLSASFETLPDEMIHAARSLGAGRMSILRHIVLPLSTPSLMAGGLMSFIGSFEEFDKSFVVGAPIVQTLPIKMYIFLDPQTLEFPLASIVAFMLLLPVLVVFVIAGRVMRDDIMASGMGKV